MKKTKAATLYSGETKNTNIHTGIISQKCGLFKSAHEYIEHLYGYDTEGYVQILQLDNNKVLHVYNTDYNGVADIIEHIVDSKDTYITPNTFYIPRRATSNIRHLRSLYIDIDLRTYGKNEAIYEAYIQAKKGEIPKPTMIVDSGRGIHLYWRIENAPIGAIHTWQELEDYLFGKLEYLGADIKATDAARLMRLPGTLNTKNKATCKIIEINDTRYSLRELREQYLHTRKKVEQERKKTANQEAKVYNCFNSYSLHYYRVRDLETLCQLRNYRVTGYRNTIIHCYAYWLGIYTRDSEELRNKVYELNRKFSEPLKDTEVDAVLRCVPKAINEFIYYQECIRTGQTKEIPERNGYNYKNESLIEMLDITVQEQQYMETIISEAEKRRRLNERRKNMRRNEAGITAREQRKQDTIQKVMELAKQGLKQVEIAKELGVNQSSISRILNGKY